MFSRTNSDVISAVRRLQAEMSTTHQSEIINNSQMFVMDGKLARITEIIAAKSISYIIAAS
jgi:hypothetical protein